LRTALHAEDRVVLGSIFEKGVSTEKKMSTLREKIEKKKNKYLEAAKNIRKKKNKEDEDESPRDGSDGAADDDDTISEAQSPKAETPYKVRLVSFSRCIFI
jgi:hypothetical protein